ncbi:hypothetical protein M422DRAFT_53152 [Sphaerobolus stellatus SS14]|uniref:Uncharacterized protein n=1 Tax=Sphaerobolus stellatus (strain SS14) TaxID=990650 RepID=A0A0C9V3A2_SPHS4|nr:hypothetical protein M422DRAFT_53152 [Sphaerobolus stellatus SS14]
MNWPYYPDEGITAPQSLVDDHRPIMHTDRRIAPIVSIRSKLLPGGSVLTAPGSHGHLPDVAAVKAMASSETTAISSELQDSATSALPPSPLVAGESTVSSLMSVSLSDALIDHVVTSSPKAVLKEHISSPDVATLITSQPLGLGCEPATDHGQIMRDALSRSQSSQSSPAWIPLNRKARRMRVPAGRASLPLSINTTAHSTNPRCITLSPSCGPPPLNRNSRPPPPVNYSTRPFDTPTSSAHPSPAPQFGTEMVDPSDPNIQPPAGLEDVEMGNMDCSNAQHATSEPMNNAEDWVDGIPESQQYRDISFSFSGSDGRESSLPPVSPASSPVTRNSSNSAMDKVVSLFERFTSKTLPIVEKLDARLTALEATVQTGEDLPSGNTIIEDNSVYDGNVEFATFAAPRRSRASTNKVYSTPKKKRGTHTGPDNHYNDMIRRLMRYLLTPLEFRQEMTVTNAQQEIQAPVHAYPSDEALLEFQDGSGEGPSYSDFSIAWLPKGVGRAHPLRKATKGWNEEAAHVFAAAFVDRLNAHHYDPDCQEWEESWKGTGELVLRFLSKLQNFNATFEKAYAERAGTTEEYRAKEIANRKRTNANSRRTSTYHIRELTVLYSPNLADEHRHQYLSVLRTLGAAGMTSDESETEGSEVKNPIDKIWRSRTIKAIFGSVDCGYDKKTKLGTDRRGAPKRIVGMPSKRVNDTPIPGLSCTFYDTTWLSKLPAARLRALKVGPPMELPPLIEL